MRLNPPEADPVQIKLDDLDARVARIERVVSNQSLVQLAQNLDSVQAETRRLRGRIDELENSNETMKKQLASRVSPIVGGAAAAGAAGGANGAYGAAGGGGAGSTAGGTAGGGAANPGRRRMGLSPADRLVPTDQRVPQVPPGTAGPGAAGVIGGSAGAGAAAVGRSRSGSY